MVHVIVVTPGTISIVALQLCKANEITNLKKIPFNAQTCGETQRGRSVALLC